MHKFHHRVVYLAAPYSHSDSAVVEARMTAVAQTQVRLVEQGVCVVTPLMYHWISPHINWPLDWSHFEEYSGLLMRRCEVLAVLNLDGWRESVGVNAEIQLAREAGIQVYLIDRDSLAITPW